MTITPLFNSLYKRFLLASALWLICWPILYYVKLGEITGPKAWFWIIGELNYPVVAIAYLILDSLFQHWLSKKPWMIFAGSVAVIAIGMPFYYEKYGFALGVTIEARFL